jgi:hypothetical protein
MESRNKDTGRAPGGSKLDAGQIAQQHLQSDGSKKWDTVLYVFNHVAAYPGTDVMIFKILSPKKLRKNGVFGSKQS